MSARKRSSMSEEVQSSSSSSSTSPASKRIRSSSSSSSTSSPSHSQLNHLLATFPFLDNKLIEQVLENCGHDLELSTKSLNDLCRGCIENDCRAAAAAFTNNHTQPQPIAQPPGSVSSEDPSLPKDSLNGVEWVEYFVREMSASSDVNDARIRVTRALQAFEKCICAHATARAAQSFQQENLMLKEQAQALLYQNGILKRAVSIQHERQKEFEVNSGEVHQLKQLLSQCQGHVRTLEVNNYALGVHLKQAQQNSNPAILRV